jgi:hypothetical protein
LYIAFPVLWLFVMVVNILGISQTFYSMKIPFLKQLIWMHGMKILLVSSAAIDNIFFKVAF